MAKIAARWAGDIASADTETIALVVAFRTGRRYSLGQVPIAGDVVASLAAIVSSTIARVAGSTSVSWSAESAWEESEHQVVQRDQLTAGNHALEALEEREFDDVERGDFAGRPIAFYAIVTGGQPGPGEHDERLIFVRKSSPRYNAERKMLAVLGDVLTRVTQPVFAFDDFVDFVLAPGQGLLAFSERPFNLLFRDAPELLARTPVLAGAVADGLPLAPGGKQVLIDAAVHYSRVRTRILAFSSKGYAATLTPDAIRAELVRQQLDPLEYMTGDQLIITSSNVQDVVRILNEDLLAGGFSGQRFDIARKRPL